MAEKAEGLVRQVNHLVEMADVAHHAVRFDPVGAQPRHGLFESRFIDICEYDAGSAAGELGGSGQTNAARTAGDDRSAPLESVHGTELYFRQLPASMGRVTPVM